MRAKALDVESIRLPNGLSVPFAIAWREFERNPHEYIGNRKNGTLIHAPLHTYEMNLYIVKEFFENSEIVEYVKKSDAWSRKILDFLMSAPSHCEKIPYVDILKKLASDKESTTVLAHCINADLESIWNGDRIFGTNIFPSSGPHAKVSRIPGWDSLRFVCTRKAFTDPSLNKKILKKYPNLIDTSLEALVLAMRGDSNFRQNHLPHDDVDLLIEVLDHVYTHVSKQEFWNLIQMSHDHYDCIPVNVHKPGSIQYDTIQVSDSHSLKN